MTSADGRSELALGVDIGGTKTEAVVVRFREETTSAGGARAPLAVEELARRRVPTGRDEGYEHVLETVAALVFDVTRAAGLTVPPPVGVGMPGGTTHRGANGERLDVPLVKNSNTTCLNGRPFRRDLAVRLGEGPGRPVVFANDANCFALAEATLGAARGARVAFGVILGTGVGGGVVFEGTEGSPRVWDGAQGIAGEWGHVVLEPRTGPRCYCGKRGCVEQYLSGPAIENAYAARAGERRPVAEIVARRDVDLAARVTCAEVVLVFGRAMATVIDVLDPDVVVLGGGVSNVDLFYDEGREEVARQVFNDELATRIVKHEMGDSAGVLGAALLTRSSPS